MANRLVGRVGEDNMGALALRDHNGRLEVIPVGDFDYAMLTPVHVAELITLCANFLVASIQESDRP